MLGGGIVASGVVWVYLALLPVVGAVYCVGGVNVASERGSHAKHSGMVSAHVVATLPAAWCRAPAGAALSRFRGGNIASGGRFQCVQLVQRFTHRRGLALV